MLERTARRLLVKPERPTPQLTRRPPRSPRKLQQKTLNGQRARRRPTPKSELPKHSDLPSDHLERCSARSTHPRLLLRAYSARPATGWTLSQETCHIRPHPRARLTLQPPPSSTRPRGNHPRVRVNHPPHDAHATITARRFRCCSPVLTVPALCEQGGRGSQEGRGRAQEGREGCAARRGGEEHAG